ncbi:MAG TPA: serine/threonine protein kinase [bacterium]|nr:serine/threonine protein kinase [bacterium]
MRETEFFFRLTPDVMLAAVERLGLQPTGHGFALNSLENRVYAMALADGNFVVAKFYRPERWTRDQLRAEHAFTAELAAADIPVCTPLVFAGETVHEIDGIYYAVWPRTGGRMVDEFSAAQLESLGALLARIHLVGAQRPAPERVVFSAESMVRRPLALLQERGLLPDSCAARYCAAAEQVASRYETESAGVPQQRIHGDAHPGNLLRGDSGFFFLDFDDCVMGPAVQDFWMLWPETGEAGRCQRAAFLAGYAQFREYDPAWLRLPEILRAMRWIHYAAWIARRWADPAFPAAFPAFGTAKYWEQETRDLEQQLTVIDRALNPQAPPPPERELTNKDFFWDLAE